MMCVWLNAVVAGCNSFLLPLHINAFDSKWKLFARTLIDRICHDCDRNLKCEMWNMYHRPPHKRHDPKTKYARTLPAHSYDEIWRGLDNQILHLAAGSPTTVPMFVRKRVLRVWQSTFDYESDAFQHKLVTSTKLRIFLPPIDGSENSDSYEMYIDFDGRVP